jgi:predicted Rossmann-fold nucleotide-binding protein
MDAELPDIDDLPLLAQYYTAVTPGGLEALRKHVLLELSRVSPTPTDGHNYLSEVPVDDIWTTNYDCLLEKTMPDVRVVASDDDIRNRHLTTKRRLTKMHGSLTLEQPIKWRTHPIITRADYEQYERLHPRMWASLVSTYLTRTFLFLGFSFTDPNIEVLLRLSRRLADSGAPEHFTILRRPGDPGEERLFRLRVDDLEQSGVGVCEIDDYAELEPFLKMLALRTRPPVLYVTGSGRDGADVSIQELGNRLGHRLADEAIDIVSLGGSAGLAVSLPFDFALRAAAKYSPTRIRFYFRQKEGSPTPALPRRLGTAIYTGRERSETVQMALGESRAVAVLGGGPRTLEEVGIAREQQLPVVPLPTSRGVAKQIYDQFPVETLLSGINISSDVSRDWANLADPNADIAAAAGARLLRLAMYLGSQ